MPGRSEADREESGVFEDLAAHPRVAALLGGPSIWHRVEHHEEADSTNDVALAAARAGEPPGLVVVADRQRAGRGRAGRAWEDRPATQGGAGSLLCTAVVADPETSGTLVPLAAGLAVLDAVRRQGARPRLKWPNDVLLDGRKTAGILVERHEVDAGHVLLVGIGINTDWRGVERTEEQAAWTSIAEVSGRDVDRGDLLADLLRGLATWLHSLPTDPLRLLVAYRDACATIDTDVRVSFPDGDQLTGRAVDLDREGRLVVESAQGPVAINAGDIEHLRPQG
jgi:BirA family transcriptional regulator, biotin operon repressor / biotin---[acetyl-CoA-carboxylase] ligase